VSGNNNNNNNNNNNITDYIFGEKLYDPKKCPVTGKTNVTFKGPRTRLRWTRNVYYPHELRHGHQRVLSITK